MKFVNGSTKANQFDDENRHARSLSSELSSIAGSDVFLLLAATGFYCWQRRVSIAGSDVFLLLAATCFYCWQRLGFIDMHRGAFYYSAANPASLAIKPPRKPIGDLFRLGSLTLRKSLRI